MIQVKVNGLDQLRRQLDGFSDRCFATAIATIARLGKAGMDKGERVATRGYVDFNYVEPKHAAIDAWLVNWARWAADRDGRFISPTFRLYRSTDAAQVYGALAAESVDIIAAKAAQKAVTALPARNRLAISWCYIKRDNPRAAAQSLGESIEGLALLIRNGRQMLVNREVLV